MYKSFDHFVLRTPLLPFSGLDLLLSDIDDLLIKLSDPLIQEAIFIASPMFYEELEKISSLKKEELCYNKAFLAFIRYLSRMSTRCTPFGLFSYCSVGNISDKNEMLSPVIVKRKTRIDTSFLVFVYDKLSSVYCKKMKYIVNTSLYLIGDKYRYIEYQYENGRRIYSVSEVDRTKYLDDIVKITDMKIDYMSLVAILTKYDVTIEEAESYIYDLIKSQILFSELHDSIVGDDLCNRIIKLFKSFNIEDELFFNIQMISDKCSSLDSQNNELIVYKDIIDNIKKIGFQFDKKCLFQVDAVREYKSLYLHKNIVDELVDVLFFLNKISIPVSSSNLLDFSTEFYSRYENEMIPLSLALDPELGLGYPLYNNTDLSPFVDDIVLPPKYSDTQIKLNEVKSILLNKYFSCLSNNEYEMILCDKDFENIDNSMDDLPPTIYVMFEIINVNSERKELKIKSVGGSCAANLFTRFAHLDKSVKLLIEEIVSKEEEILNDKILVELVHLPEDRVGNILARPHLRENELLYLSNSDLNRFHVLNISDLMLVVRKGKLILYSKKFKNEVVPRLTNAHNFHVNNLPIYHFLCDMQNSFGRVHLAFNAFDDLMSDFHFFPRIKYKNTILSPAKWIVMINDISYLFAINDNQELLYRIEKWRFNIFMPDRVLLRDDDNELYVLWTNILSVRALFSIIKKRTVVTFVEFLFTNTSFFTPFDSEIYTNEYIVPFYKINKCND